MTDTRAPQANFETLLATAELSGQPAGCVVRQGYSAYLPRYRTRVSHARRRQTALRPLFPRYLFAGIDRASMRWRPILSTSGVADVVRAGDEPAAVPSKIVASGILLNL